MALLGQRAENHWVGVNCGIMDQMISAIGKRDHAVLIDCRDLSAEPLPLPADTAVVIMDTSTRRGLVDSAYNERAGPVRSSGEILRGSKHCRQVSREQFEAGAESLDASDSGARARHVISENDRTLSAAQAMKAGDAAKLGQQLINESHVSLRDDFAVSNPQLDAIVHIASGTPGCWGLA